MTQIVSVLQEFHKMRGQKKQVFTEHQLGSLQAFGQMLPCAISFNFQRNPMTVYYAFTDEEVVVQRG